MLRIFPRLRRIRKMDIKKMNAFLMAKCCLPWPLSSWKKGNEWKTACGNCAINLQSVNWKILRIYLRIFEPHFMRKVKNIQPQQKIHYSYKKKSVSYSWMKWSKTFPLSRITPLQPVWQYLIYKQYFIAHYADKIHSSSSTAGRSEALFVK